MNERPPATATTGLEALSTGSRAATHGASFRSDAWWASDDLLEVDGLGDAVGQPVEGVAGRVALGGGHEPRCRRGCDDAVVAECGHSRTGNPVAPRHGTPSNTWRRSFVFFFFCVVPRYSYVLLPGSRVLDIGSALGGPARHFAEMFGAHVTGIDLTQEYVDVANELTRRCGLAERAVFRQASALDLPFTRNSFDRASLIHVGMNIADKATLFAEVRRVLEPGALFVVYDIMKVGNGDVPYPMPWAATCRDEFRRDADHVWRLACPERI